MPSGILIISSFVAASRVGGGAQAMALARLGLEPVLVPTVLFGRHPGHGPPGGQAVAAETISSMLAAIETQGVFASLAAMIVGYVASPEQAAAAAAAIDAVRAQNAAARIVVDPIMGDAPGGLYVREEAAEAIATLLIPRADLVAPNAWELQRLTGLGAEGPSTAVRAAGRLGRPALVSSVRAGDDIGIVYADGAGAWLAAHAEAPAAPKGVGDLLTGYFTAALVQGLAGGEALAAAAGALADIVTAAQGLSDPPMTSLPTRLAPSSTVRLEPLDG
jgi:pyridoxine kinase